MNIKKLEATYASQVATLLNEHLPFEEENEQTILQAGGIQLIALVDDKVVGYIAGYEIQQVTVKKQIRKLTKLRRLKKHRQL